MRTIQSDTALGNLICLRRLKTAALKALNEFESYNGYSMQKAILEAEIQEIDYQIAAWDKTINES